MKLVSFDASTKKTGVGVFINGELENKFLLDYSGVKDRESRMREMASAIIELLDNENPDIVLIEDSWSKANVDITKLLTRIMGVTFGWAVANDKEWHTLLPSEWRRLCKIDQGKKVREELKQASIDYVFGEYGVLVSDDVADAIALGRGYINSFY